MSLQQAKEDLKAAENHLQLIKEGVTKESDNASNTLIRSTINGMVLDVPVEIGNSVIETNTFNPGTTIAVVADMTDMIFEGKVDETEVGKIRTGMNIELTIGAIDKERFDAVLEYIAPKGVEENGAIQFEIKAKVRLKETQFIRAGYSATADIVLEKKDSVMAIPESVLKWDDEDSAFVEVKTGEEGQWEKKYVDLGISDGINIEIVSGLNEEDEIKSMEKREGKEKV
jgi:HlyD family secretion protein